MKKRIAIWMHGGIGTGQYSQGYPLLEKILNGIAENYELVVYSHATPNNDYKPTAFSMRFPPKGNQSSLYRWIFLLKYFVKDHRSKKFETAFSFWGYPAGFLVVILAKVFRMKSVVYVLGGDVAGIPAIDYGILHKYFPRKIALWTYQQASLLLGISDYQKGYLNQYGVGRNMIVIPWGVELSKYLFKTDVNIQDPVNIIHVGHLTAVKDQVTLLKAFALIVQRKNASLNIFGADAGMRAKLDGLCDELHIQKCVHFRGLIPYRQMPEQYASADVLLHTSLSEGQCLAVTEGAATGLLLAGTKVGLLYDLDDNSAIRVELGDYRTLADRVLSDLNDIDEFNRKRMNARSWAETHDLEWTVQKLKEVLSRL